MWVPPVDVCMDAYGCEVKDVQWCIHKVGAE